MQTADIETTYLSEQQFMVQSVANSALGDAIVVLLMLAPLVL